MSPQVTPTQLQKWVDVVLDQFERDFLGSSMADLKLRRMSASEEMAEEHRKKREDVRERKRRKMEALAIGDD